MKKLLKPILVITFIVLVLLAFKQSNSRETGIYRTGKMKSPAEAGFFAPLLRDSSITVKKQATITQSKDKGVGPIKELKLEPINQKLANDGKVIFTAKCTVCHSLDLKIIGPPLRNVTKTRSPEYIMNMILNPGNMEKADLIVKELHKKYIATPMTDQGFTQDQARSLLEYLRTAVK